MQETLINKRAIPFISIILPCYNEEVILEMNVNTIIYYLENKTKYKWEIVIVNDGSSDKTGVIADNLENKHNEIKVIHHPTNLNLGRALQTGFCNTKGDIIVVMDIDLSYSVDHIGRMVDKIMETSCDLVLASPYMKGGKVTAVPALRKIMSIWLNRFIRFSSGINHHTYTGMVRAYKANFIRKLNLKSSNYQINPEIIYKAIILRARIIEIPAHLDWTEQNKYEGKRTSGIRILSGFFSGLMSAFIFRPYIFFISIGTILMILSLYELTWLLFETLTDLKIFFSSEVSALGAFSLSLAQQFTKSPQTFLVGGITFLAAMQFLSLGFISLQSKRYFEELFHLGTSFKK